MQALGAKSWSREIARWPPRDSYAPVASQAVSTENQVGAAREPGLGGEQVSTRREPQRLPLQVLGSVLDISIVIPTHNRPALVQRTIESVLGQTVPAREIIIVDNGTNSETEQALQAYGDRLTYMRMPPVGVQAARTAGMDAATSEWVALLDDDDLYRPEFIEHVSRAAADDRTDLISTDLRKFVQELSPENQLPLTNFGTAPPAVWEGIPQPSGDLSHSFVGQFPVERLLRFIPFYPSTLVAKRSLIARAGPQDPGVKGMRSEDIEYTARLLTHGSLSIVWVPLVDYRIHAGNDSGGDWKAAVGRFQVFEYMDRNGDYLSPAVRAAVAADIPVRAPRAFDLAFATRQFDIARSIAPHMRSGDWTLKRKIKLQFLRIERARARLSSSRGVRKAQGATVG